MKDYATMDYTVFKRVSPLTVTFAVYQHYSETTADKIRNSVYQ